MIFFGSIEKRRKDVYFVVELKIENEESYYEVQYRVDEKYATASVKYQNKNFFGKPFYEFKL